MEAFWGSREYTWYYRFLFSSVKVTDEIVLVLLNKVFSSQGERVVMTWNGRGGPTVLTSKG
jgi:hypothetical protein